MKIIGLRHHYFTAAWNLFDFVLVIASIFGILVEVTIEGHPEALANDILLNSHENP